MLRPEKKGKGDFFKGSAGWEGVAGSLPDRPSRKRYKAKALGK